MGFVGAILKKVKGKGKKKNKNPRDKTKQLTGDTPKHDTNKPNSTNNNNSNTSNNKNSSSAKSSFHKQWSNKVFYSPRNPITNTSKYSSRPSPQGETSTEPTMSMLSSLIQNLVQAKETSNEKPARALRSLFALSEHGHTENRTEMVRLADGKLVPTLLSFLERCDHGSSEQYLTLLVLNNISIPSENKRMVALDYGGAEILARLLCDDPSCHLMAIVLVNLTFAEVDLRRELVTMASNFELIDSLAFALRVASLTHEEYEARQPLVECMEEKQSAKERLAALLAEDHRDVVGSRHRDATDPAEHLFPETARWCLSALKNLTRPSKDISAANALVKTGIVPLILQFITIAGTPRSSLLSAGQDGSNSSSDETPIASDPIEGFTNSPAFWDPNSMQDASLFIIMNLASVSSSRTYIDELDAVSILSFITEYRIMKFEKKNQFSIEQLGQQDFQCLKARIALAYLVGSEGHFGQNRLGPSASTVYASPDDSVLVLGSRELSSLIALLADTMHDRGRDGAGGYSAATFNIKQILYALRCLLTHTLNQLLVSKSAAVQLNLLLIKALAQHSVLGATTIDPEAAEYAVFMLYLQSNYGFQKPFLPSMYSSPDEQNDLTAKILTSYLKTPSITPAGRHAAEQLLLRLKYLMFKGTVPESAACHGMAPSAADLSLGGELLSTAEKLYVGERVHGAEPKKDIFSRPILRSRAQRRGSVNAIAPWDNNSSLSAFPSAIMAVQQLSYGSTKVRHIDAIDDVLIANNIASSANGEKTESYKYLWSWEDKANEIQRNLIRQRSQLDASSVSLFGGSKRKPQAAPLGSPTVAADEGPLSIFGFRCNMCAVDTTDW